MTPDFVTYDDKQRESFLSQLGNFSPGERELFRQLCRAWQEKIPFTRFSAMSGVDSSGNSEIVSLINKLRRERIGVLRTKMVEERRLPDHIVLATQNSTEFFTALVDEYFTDLHESLMNSMPLESVVQQEVSRIPRESVEPVDVETLSEYVSERRKSDKILRVAAINEDALLITQVNLKSFVSFAILKLRFYFSNPNLLGAVAKLRGSSLLELKKLVSGKDPTFWLELTKTIDEHRTELISSRNLSVETGFFHAATLLRRFVESQIHAANVKRQEREERDLDLKAVALAIKEDPDVFVDQMEVTRVLDNQREKYGDEFERFREEFYERYVKARERNSLPEVILMSNRYIHRDNVFPTFIGSFKDLEPALRAHYRALMVRQLKSSQGNPVFFSLDNLDESITNEVAQRDPLIGALMQKPAILAEALIYHAKKNKLVKTVADIKHRLALYFDPASLKPLRPHQWFGIRLTEVFDAAFDELPIIRRIWMRITGKHKNLKKLFAGRSEALPVPVIPKPAPARSNRDFERDERRERPRRRPQSRRPAPHRTRSAPPTKSKEYTQKQVDSAWESFGQTLSDD